MKRFSSLKLHLLILSSQLPHRRVTFSTSNQAQDLQDASQHSYYDSGLEESETPSSKSSSGPRIGPLALPEDHYERTTPDGSIGEMEHPENGKMDFLFLPSVCADPHPGHVLPGFCSSGKADFKGSCGRRRAAPPPGAARRPPDRPLVSSLICCSSPPPSIHQPGGEHACRQLVRRGRSRPTFNQIPTIPCSGCYLC